MGREDLQRGQRSYLLCDTSRLVAGYRGPGSGIMKDRVHRAILYRRRVFAATKRQSLVWQAYTQAVRRCERDNTSSVPHWTVCTSVGTVLSNAHRSFLWTDSPILCNYVGSTRSVSGLSAGLTPSHGTDGYEEVPAGCVSTHSSNELSAYYLTECTLMRIHISPLRIDAFQFSPGWIGTPGFIP
jgi:hypothetical protein